MMRMPSAATARMLSVKSRWRGAPGRSARNVVGSGMLSTTVRQRRPAGRVLGRALRAATASRGHGTRAVLMQCGHDLTRASLAHMVGVTGSSSPYQRHACRICHPRLFVYIPF
jgi:hypothetical protein